MKKNLEWGKSYMKYLGIRKGFYRQMKSRPINYLMFIIKALILFQIVPQFHKNAI